MDPGFYEFKDEPTTTPRPNGRDHPSGGPTSAQILGFNLRDWEASKRFKDEAPNRQWTISQVAPRGVAGLLVAAGDTGKSFTALDLCLHVSRGPCCEGPERRILGGFVDTFGATVFITAEDGGGTVHRRLQSLDPDESRRRGAAHPMYVVPLPDVGGPFPVVAEERGRAMPTPQFAELREMLKTIPDLALVVLDPLQCFVHADINSDPQAAALTMSMLNALAAETGATVLATHHVRKEKEAPKSAQEARNLIHGSSALVDQSRFAIVLWPPDEAEARRICQALGKDFRPNAIVQSSVVKSNDEADRTMRSLLRLPNGSFEDVTERANARERDREVMLADLLGAIADAAVAGRPLTKTAGNGVYERRAELPENLRMIGRDRLHGLVQELLDAKRVVQALAPGSTTTKWLDSPDGPFARGEGRFAPGAGKGEAEGGAADHAPEIAGRKR